MAISTKCTPDERELLDAVRTDHAWQLVEEFSHLVRESGTAQELEAVDRITSRLERWGIPHAVHQPELWISLPREASLIVDAATYRAKTPSMAASTPESGLRAPVLHGVLRTEATRARNRLEGALLDVQDAIADAGL